MTEIVDATLPSHNMQSYSFIRDSEPSPSLKFIRNHLKLKHDISEQSFFVVDLGVVKKRFHEWSVELPRVRPFYAIKCNPNLEILGLLRDLGIGFDCASFREMQIMLDLGVNPNDLIFANPCKMPSHLNFARERGIKHMTFDNYAELEKIKRYAPDSKLVLRILTDDSHSICRFGAKFGAPPQHIPLLLRRALELDLDVVGVSFHVGSGCLSTSSYVEAVERAYNTFKIAEAMGIKMNLLDIGGGFPGVSGKGPAFSDIASTLRGVLDELFPEGCGVQIISEPGRFFVAESHTLATCIYARRDIDLEKHYLEEPEETDKLLIDRPLSHLYYISDGVYGSFNCLFFDHAEIVPKMVHYSEGPLYKATIFGPTCDSLDCIAKEVLLPQLEVGEWLYFENMGAYTLSAASEFNGFNKAAFLFIDSSI